MELVAVLMGFKQKPVSEIEMAGLENIISALEDSQKASKEWLMALLHSDGSLEDERTAPLITKHSKMWDVDVVEALLNSVSRCQQTEKLYLLSVSAFKSLELDDQKKLLENFFRKNGVNAHFKMPDFDTQVTTVLNRSASLQCMRDKVKI